MQDRLGELFSDVGFDALWYTGCWFAGTWTGPQHDLICVKTCRTNEEAEIWLSPEGKTPEEAARLAVAKRTKLAVGRRICHRCGSMGAAWPKNGDLPKYMDWCMRCDKEDEKPDDLKKRELIKDYQAEIVERKRWIRKLKARKGQPTHNSSER